MSKKNPLNEKGSRSASLTKSKFLPSKNSLEKQLYSISEIDENESSEMVVKYAMEDLMSNVMDRIYEIYIEKQKVNFTVHCAHKAFEKILSLHCYQHDAYEPFHDENDKSWVPDLNPEPSPLDSWAANRLLTDRIEITPQTEMNTLSQIKIEREEEDAIEGTKSIIALPEDTEDTISEYSRDSNFSVSKIMDRIIDNMNFSSDSDSSGRFLKQASVFSIVAKESVEYLAYEIKPGYSKVQVEHDLRLPQIVLPEHSSPCGAKKDIERQKSGSLDTFEHLPPIRSSAKNKYHVESPEPCKPPSSSSRKKK